MTGYVSKDGHWHLTVIKLDGVQRIRVEHDTIKPVHWDGTHRCGTFRTAHGFWVADVRRVEDIARYVPLSELEAVK